MVPAIHCSYQFVFFLATSGTDNDAQVDINDYAKAQVRVSRSCRLRRRIGTLATCVTMLATRRLRHGLPPVSQCLQQDACNKAYHLRHNACNKKPATWLTTCVTMLATIRLRQGLPGLHHNACNQMPATRLRPASRCPQPAALMATQATCSTYS